jgi:hypothetical protein
VGVYRLIKFVFLYSLVRTQIKSEAMKDHYVFLAFLYTADIAFLSYVFIVSWQPVSWAPWQIQLAQKARHIPLAGLAPRNADIVSALLPRHGEV